MGPRVGVDEAAKRKSPYPCRGSKPGRPARSLVTMLTELARREKENTANTLPEVELQSAQYVLLHELPHSQ
jgi:hypothetical protein